MCGTSHTRGAGEQVKTLPTHPALGKMRTKLGEGLILGRELV